jgi:hypothetical protein
MNDELLTIDDCELERLADGELSPPALRELLIRLDRVDDGWKRAALALLEAQTLRSACRAVIAAPPSRSTPQRIGSVKASSTRGLRELVALAAAVLMTCGLGWWSLSTMPSSSQPVVRSVFTPAEEEAAADAVQMAFAQADGEWSDPITAQVIDADDPAAQEWLTMRPTIPDAVRERLAAQGQRVHEQQTWVPVDLADGRVGVVPVTDVIVTPARSSDYQ